MAVIRHLVEESSVSITSSGIEVVDQYMVTELGGLPSARSWLATQQGGIPRYGDRHPSISGIFADSITARPEKGSDTPNTFRVSVTSRRPVLDSSDSGDDSEIDDSDYGTLEFFYTTRDVQTQLDVDNKQITVSHTYTEADPKNRAGLTVTQAGTVTLQTFQQGIRFSRLESESPAALQATYAFHLNKTAWNGYGARTVMCIGIDGDTTDGGVTWPVNYAFMLDPFRNWAKDVIFSDEESGGDPPPDLVLGVGYKTVDVYPVIDFAPLNIDFTKMRRKPSGGRRGKSPIGYRIGG